MKCIWKYCLWVWVILFRFQMCNPFTIYIYIYIYRPTKSRYSANWKVIYVFIKISLSFNDFISPLLTQWHHSNWQDLANSGSTFIVNKSMRNKTNKQEDEHILVAYCISSGNASSVWFSRSAGILSNLLYKAHSIQKLKCFTSYLAVVLAQSVEARCSNAPTTSDWSTI